MTTKKDSAAELVVIARMIHQEMAGDEDADGWVQHLLTVARGLDPMISYGRLSDVYFELLVSEKETTKTKLRRLIEHPGTPTIEREAAVAALARIRNGGRT